MRSSALLLAAGFVLLALSPAVSASCEPRTSSAIAAGDHYVTWTCHATDVDRDMMCTRAPYVVGALLGNCTYFVYQESNGIPGLQRQDAYVDGTCGGAIPADTLIA